MGTIQTTFCNQYIRWTSETLVSADLNNLYLFLSLLCSHVALQKPYPQILKACIAQYIIRGLSSSDLRIVPITNVSKLKPNVRTRIGEILFAPGRDCPHHFACLEKLPCEKDDSDDIKNHVVSVRDVLALQKREQNWSQHIIAGETNFRTKVTLETDLISGTELHVKAALKRPEFVDSPLQFQLTQLLTTSSKMLHVRNPARVPVTMRLMTTSDNQVMHDGFLTIPVEGRKQVIVPEFGELDLGPIEFRPSFAVRYATKIYIRNNLTGLYAVDVKGMGGSGDLVMLVDDNVATEDVAESAPINFRLNITHVTKPQWGMTKVIRALNRGNLALEIKGMMLNSDAVDENFLCKHGGFEIMDCSELSFTLLPNEAREFVVTFTPDCSMSEVEQRLTITTSVGAFTRTLAAVIPPEVMKPCYNEARSRWRAEMGWAWTIWSLALLAVVAAVLSKLALAVRSYFSQQAKAKLPLLGAQNDKLPAAKKVAGSPGGVPIKKPKGATATKVSSEPRKKRKKRNASKVDQQKNVKSSAQASSPANKSVTQAANSTPAVTARRGSKSKKAIATVNKTASKHQKSKKPKQDLHQANSATRQSKATLKSAESKKSRRTNVSSEKTSNVTNPGQTPVQAASTKKKISGSGFQIVDTNKSRETPPRAGRSEMGKVSRDPPPPNAATRIASTDTKASKPADRTDKKEKDKEKKDKKEKERLLRLKKREKALKAEEERKKLQKEFDALKKQQQEKRKEKKLKKDKNKKRIDPATTVAPAKTNSAWTSPQSLQKSSAFAASTAKPVESTFPADGNNRRNWDSAIGPSSKKPSVSGWNTSPPRNTASSKPAFNMPSKVIGAPISKPIHSPGMLYKGTNRKRPSLGTIGMKPMPAPIGAPTPKGPVRGPAPTPIGGPSNIRPSTHTWDSYDDGSSAGTVGSWTLSSIRQPTDSSSNFGAIGGSSRNAGVIGGRAIGSKKSAGMSTGGRIGLFNPRGAAHPPGMFGVGDWRAQQPPSSSSAPPGFDGWGSSPVSAPSNQLFGSSLFSSNPSSMFSDAPAANENSNSNDTEEFGRSSLWSTPWAADAASEPAEPADSTDANAASNPSGRVLESFFAADGDGYGDFSGGALEEDDF